MNNRAVKIVKKIEKDRMPDTCIAANPLKAVVNTGCNTAQTVNGWISERRENSRMEKTASDNAIRTWNLSL